MEVKDILVIGSGGREHALIRKLKESPWTGKLYCAPGNGGIAADAKCVPIRATDIEGMTAFAKENKIGFCVVAPDDPLALGMVDAMNQLGIPTFGPTKAAARIESSKVFSKNLMKKYGIPTADYETFDDPQKAVAYLQANQVWPIVIKADGLALGKGVLICQDLAEAEKAVHSIMEEKQFGASGNHIVIEEFLTGPEVSVLSFCDGKTCIPMVSSMDHKRALDGDEGLNTGGMGTVAPNIHYTPAVAEECMEKIFKPTLAAMQAEGCPFSGCLYFGLMITPKGPYVIEYNCRFGDPETQVVLPLLETDLVEIMTAIWGKRLDQFPIRFSKDCAACIVLASGGYPVKYETGFPISGLDQNGQHPNAIIYHAGTKYVDHTYQTAGGRVLGVTCTGPDMAQAIKRAYCAAEQITFEGVHFRKDIGKKNM